MVTRLPPWSQYAHCHCGAKATYRLGVARLPSVYGAIFCCADHVGDVEPREGLDLAIYDKNDRRIGIVKAATQ